MSSAIDQFHRWEAFGRGEFPLSRGPVRLQPPFEPFEGYRAREENFDDGRRHTFLSRLFASDTPKSEDDAPLELVPESIEEGSPSEFITHLPKDYDVSDKVFGQLLLSLEALEKPVSMDLVGTKNEIRLLFSCGEDEERGFVSAFSGYAPEVVLEPAHGQLRELWPSEGESAVFQLIYLNSFLYQLQSGESDIFGGLCGGLSDLEDDEVAVFQILFSRVSTRWNRGILDSCFDANDRGFVHLTEMLTKAGKEKASEPLFAVAVRIGAKAKTYEGTIDILSNMARALAPLNGIGGNELTVMPLEGYDTERREKDLLQRQTVRPGMLMTLSELLQLVHLPSKEVKTPKWKRGIQTTRSASNLGNDGDVSLGINTHRGVSKEVHLGSDLRVCHMHVLGMPGSGKSTFLEHLIRQDIEAGRGVCVVDPHGDLIDSLLGAVPQSRLDDTILFDPADPTHAVGFNILATHSEQERTILAGDLVSVFARLSTSWGDQMGVVLRNAISAFLESSKGGTLSDLRRFLLDESYRDSFLETVGDREIQFFWKHGFKTLTGGKSIGPIITRLETFLAPKQIRHIVSSRGKSLNFREIMDEGKILLVKLSQGSIGEENVHLLGSLIVSKFGQVAMERATVSEKSRSDYFLYLDEFHSFITPSMAEIITGARKYRLGLVLAHQHLGQLGRKDEVASAVRSSVATQVVFNVSRDAKDIANDFGHFEAKDFQALEVGEAIVRVGRSDQDFNLKVPWPERIDQEAGRERRDLIITQTRMNYAKARSEIEAEMEESVQSISLPRKEKQTAKTEKLEKNDERNEITKHQSSFGRGGEVHKLLQERIGRIGKRKNFRATIEKSVLDGRGSIDVLLEREDLSVAVEISVTTSIRHEIGNIEKCLEAGFNQVVLVVQTEKDASKVETRIRQENFEGEKVKVMTPDQLESWLPEVEEKEKNDDRRHGWKVKMGRRKLSEEEGRKRDAEAMRRIAKVLKARDG